MDYITAIEEIGKEWSPEKVHQFTLDYLRESCEWARQKKQELEIENKEARRKGVPYSERSAYTVKIEALQGLFLKWRERGIRYSRTPVRLADVVRVEDIEYIHTNGFEGMLKSALLF